mgnify:CR=1 FL=1
MKLAVMLPAYNAENFIAECLDSLLNQTFSDFCILAVNDASTDNTGNILEDYAAKDTRLRVYHLPQNQGEPAVMQFAMDMLNYMNVEYVARMDSDDICVSHRFEKQVQYLNKNDLFVLCAIQDIENAENLLSGERIKQLINNAKKEFDFVIIDTSPIVGINDALIVAEIVDASLLVIKQNEATDYLINDMINRLVSTKNNLIGCIYNASVIDLRKTNKVYGYHYGYNQYRRHEKR